MVSYLMNCIDRFPKTANITEDNIKNAGYPIDEIIISDNGSTQQEIKDWAQGFATTFIDNSQNIGNAQGHNNMLKEAKGDFFVIAGNDIELPKGWLKAAIEMASDYHVGLVGFDWRGENLTNRYKSLKLTEGCPFGTWVFSRRVLERVGYFNEWSKYGLWDSAYALRCKHAGYLNGYLINHPSKHKGEDVGEDSDYRRMKNEELKKAKAGYSELMKQLTKSN